MPDWSSTKCTKAVREQNFKLQPQPKFKKKMSKKTKAFVYQLICFAILFIPLRFVLDMYTNLQGIWIPITAFVIATLVGPKFQAVNTNEGEKLFMKWMFIKGFKEIK